MKEAINNITRSRPGITWLVFFAGLSAGILFTSIHFTGYHLEFFPGDLADARFNMYLLEHAFRFISGLEASYWNAPFLYPEPSVISYSDNLLGTAPVYFLFRLGGLDRETAFQLWYLVMMVLNYTACFLFLRFLLKNPFAAVLGAYVFAFSMALYAQMPHAQTFPRFAIPLALWMGLLYYRSLQPRYFFWLGFWVVFQIYCGIYLGLMLMIPAGILLLFTLSKRNDYRARFRQGSWRKGMLGALAVNGVFLAMLMIPYIQRAAGTGAYTYDYAAGQLLTIPSYFFSYPGSALWKFLDETCIRYPAFWDHWVFPGGVATLSLLITGLLVLRKLTQQKFRVVSAPQKELLLLFLVALGTFLLFIRFGDFSAYRLIFHLPGFNAMRALQRIINIELLFYAMATGALSLLAFRRKQVFQLILFLLFLALLVIDNHVPATYFTRATKAESRQRVSRITRQLSQADTRKVLSFEPDSVDKPGYVQLDGMLAAQSLGMRCINGYTSTSPDVYWKYWGKPNEENRKAWLEKMGMTGLEVVVVK